MVNMWFAYYSLEYVKNTLTSFNERDESKFNYAPQRTFEKLVSIDMLLFVNINILLVLHPRDANMFVIFTISNIPQFSNIDSMCLTFGIFIFEMLTYLRL